MSLKIITWNVNGLNSPIKRKRISALLQKQRCDLICLQETHILYNHERFLENRKLGIAFSSSNQKTKKNGVVIYAKPELQPILIKKDEEGRWIIIQATLQSKKTTIVGIYSPNDKKLRELFFEELLQELLQYENTQIVILGDFNAVNNPNIDKKLPVGRKKGGRIDTLPKPFLQLTSILQIQDIWRRKCPITNGFTFYSARHASFSRIDMIWASTDLLLQTQDIETLARSCSDHNPILWSLKGINKVRHWKINHMLWSDKMFLSEAEKDLKSYFEINSTHGMPIKTVWDASKPYFRGFVIQYMAKKNRERKTKTAEILREMGDLENKLIINPGNKKYLNELLQARHQLNLILSADIAHKLRLVRLNHFENANKPGKWLAYRLKKQQAQRIITNLKDSQGITQTDQDSIMKTIEEYYQNLFKGKQIHPNLIYNYLEKHNFPQLNEEQRNLTNATISLAEVVDAIQRQKPNKTPGPDALPAQYYQKFSDILALRLYQLFNSILEGEDIPDTWKSANIVLIPKDGKPKDVIENYRPIALLNGDYKIFATILANRWRKILTTLIHSDQRGFLPNRHLQSNIRILLNSLEYYEIHSQKQAAFIFLDAEKAFDNVSWSLLKSQLDYIQCGHRMLRAVDQIYSTQNAKIIVNGLSTDKINIYKGTRQGCPLSPLLFILSLEILLHVIRNSVLIQGLNIRGETYKTQAFADDLLLILEEPSQSLPELLRVLKEYSGISGFLINKTKTVLLTKNISESNIQGLVDLSGFTHVNKAKYLGIMVSNKCSTLIDNNYIPLVKAIKADLGTWARLQLSLMGRIAAIKMSVLPKLLFIFQCLPVLSNFKILSDLEKHIRIFIWQKKKARIKNAYLQDRIKLGGFALPNLFLYYRAAALTWTRDWISMTNERVLCLEGHDLDKGWHHYLWYRGNIPTLFKRHWLRNALIKNWLSVKDLFYPKAPKWLSPMEAIRGPYPKTFSNLTYKQLLHEDQSLKPPNQLSLEGLNTDWWTYQQIYSHYNYVQKESGFMVNDNVFDKILIAGEKKLLSKFYTMLLDEKSRDSQVKECMVRWAENCRHSIHLEKWNMLWQTIKMFRSISYKENCYKMFYRWHLSPQRLSKMYNRPAKCWKCEQENGSFYHMWWTCKKVKQFWNMVMILLDTVLKVKLKYTPELLLLNIMDTEVTYEQNYVINHIIVTARILYAQLWKNPEIPSKDALKGKLYSAIEMDRLSGHLKGEDEDILTRRWQELLAVLKTI